MAESLRVHEVRPIAANREDAPEEAFYSCPCGVITDGEDEAVVHCWRTGPQPSGIGIEVNTTWERGRGLAYVAMAEVAMGWPLMEFHIYYRGGEYEFVGDTPEERRNG